MLTTEIEDAFSEYEITFNLKMYVIIFGLVTIDKYLCEKMFD